MPVNRRCGLFFWKAHLSPSAVRRKLVLVGVVEAPVYGLEDALRPAGVGIGERRAPRHHANAQVRKLASLGKHRVANLAQGVEALDDGIEHDDQMLPHFEVLDVTLPALSRLILRIFCLSSKFSSWPSIDCPIKCVPLLIVIWFLAETKVTIKAGLYPKSSACFFYPHKCLADSNSIKCLAVAKSVVKTPYAIQGEVKQCPFVMGHNDVF